MRNKDAKKLLDALSKEFGKLDAKKVELAEFDEKKVYILLKRCTDGSIADLINRCERLPELSRTLKIKQNKASKIVKCYLLA